jgi:hypothetical protein
VGSGKSLRHENLLAMAVAGEAERLRVGLVGDRSARLNPLPHWISVIACIALPQQNTD